MTSFSDLTEKLLALRRDLSRAKEARDAAANRLAIARTQLELERLENNRLRQRIEVLIERYERAKGECTDASKRTEPSARPPV